MTEETAQNTEEDIILDLGEETPAPPEATPAPEPIEKPAPVQEVPKTSDFKEEYENLKAALREERQRNREQFQTFENLRKELEDYRASKETGEKKEEFESDPINAMKRELEELKQFKNETKAEREKREREEAQKENIRLHAVRSREEFEKTTPDYKDAYAHVMDFKAKELMALGFRDQYQLNQALEFEINRMVNHAIATQQNPAALIYQMAKATGYNNAPPPMKENPAEALERIAAGQAATTNSGHGSKSGAAPKTVRLSDIDKMTTKEFEQMWEDLRRKGKLG